MMVKKNPLHSALKVLDVLEVLSSYAASGVSNTAIAKQLDIDPSAVTRATRVLQKKGWARKDETSGHFFPTPRAGQVFGRILADFSRAESELSNLKHNFTRSA
jgi:DNA-binding IclR family transcriptional regulator